MINRCSAVFFNNHGNGFTGIACGCATSRTSGYNHNIINLIGRSSNQRLNNQINTIDRQGALGLDSVNTTSRYISNINKSTIRAACRSSSRYGNSTGGSAGCLISGSEGIHISAVIGGNLINYSLGSGGGAVNPHDQNLAGIIPHRSCIVTTDSAIINEDHAGIIIVAIFLSNNNNSVIVCTGRINGDG